MQDHISIPLANSDKTASAGRSLASTLYETPSVILLEGPVGAGKTTFVQGLAAGLGVGGHVSSPTFALEQRHAARSRTLSHIDLYRLDPTGAKRLLTEETDEDADVRCIEWADRLEDGFAGPHVRIRLAEDGDARRLEATFDDVALPTDADIERWRGELRLPEHIGRHCDAVGEVAHRISLHLASQGVLSRPEAVRLAGRTHDLLRFVDFKEGAGHGPGSYAPEQLAAWEEARRRFPGLRHEQACAALMEEKGYTAFARIILPHGLDTPPGAGSTIEQAVLYYADKRVGGDAIMTVDERFDDFIRRYSDGVETPRHRRWREEVAAVERSLFSGPPPF